MGDNRQNAAAQTDLARSLWIDIARCLEDQKSRVYEEIRNYPTPITACDQQFNYLLEKQATVCGELARLRKAIDETSIGGDSIEMIDAFLRSSSCIDGELEQRIRSLLHEKNA